jgi:(p)ppGpp synthase/HD superfamily hydrolase
MNPKIKAIEFAFDRHEGQFRKGTDFPYIIHPLSVMRLLLMEHSLMRMSPGPLYKGEM